MSNRRWIKFWPVDWHGDKALRTCSVAARGLWMDMLCIAHEGEPYGHVTINGRGATAKQISNIAGLSEREAGKLLAELHDAGVFSVTEAGVFFSRRMVRDHEASEQGREAVARRWDGKGDDQTPSTPIVRGPDTLSDTIPDTLPDKDPNRGGNTLEERRKKKEEREERSSLRSLVPNEVEPDGFSAWWKDYPRKDAKQDARRAYAKALRRAPASLLLSAVRIYPFNLVEPQFIPMPATWLNGGRWENAGEVPRPAIVQHGRKPHPLDWTAQQLGFGQRPSNPVGPFVDHEFPEPLEHIA